MVGSESKPVVIAVTGGIACGKSEVGSILNQLGFSVCDADHIAHELMAKGTPVYQQVVEHFGARILAEDEEISRPVLAGIVFEDPDERRNLDRMVHPAVKAQLAEWIQDRRIRVERGAILIPLLFESGMEALDWDAIFCVSSSPDLIVDRLQRRGLSRQEAIRRIDAQMPLEKKERQSDYVIHNQGTLQQLEQATRRTVERLLTER